MKPKVFLRGGKKNGKLRKEFLSYLEQGEPVDDLSQIDDCRVEVVFRNGRIQIHRNTFVDPKPAAVYLNSFLIFDEASHG